MTNATVSNKGMSLKTESTLYSLWMEVILPWEKYIFENVRCLYIKEAFYIEAIRVREVFENKLSGFYKIEGQKCYYCR